MQKLIPPFEVLHTIRNLEDVRAAERAQPRDALPWKSTWDVFRAAAEHFGERPALTFLPTGELGEEPRRFTHHELFTHITQAANLLHRVGVGPRDAVGILAPHLPENHFALWGAEAAGIACPINPLLRVEQIVGLLRAAGARHLVALGPDESMPIWSKVEILRDHLPELEILRIDPDGAPDRAPDSTSGDDFLTRLLDEPGDALTSGRQIASDEVAAYFHTGGTTGTPKLAKHTHGNQVWAAWGGVQLYDLGPEDVQSNGLPLFHVAGTIIGFLAPIGAGAEVVALSPSGMRNPHIIRNHWRLMQAHGVTISGGVPTALAKLLEVPVEDADLSKIDTIVTGASAMPLDVARRVEEQVGAPIREVLGMTEAGGLISLTPRRAERRLGAVGLPLPHQEVQIVRLGTGGDLGDPCAPEESGMLLLRGPNITPGYRDSKHDINAFTEEGWLITGDLATRGEDGWLRVTGRVKDLIIRGGHNIDPVLIEEAVETHPSVALAAAVGQPDDYAGEVPVLYVTLRAGAESTEDELAAFVAERIAEPPARPRWIEILPEMPMTEVGKIFKPELRKRAASCAT